MAKKQTETTNDMDFLNPFNKGVNYDMFLEAKGKESVKDYCKGHLTDEQIEWLENDLKHYKK